MDPVSDAIDPSWWEDVLAAASLDDPYEPPELLSHPSPGIHLGYLDLPRR